MISVPLLGPLSEILILKSPGVFVFPVQIHFLQKQFLPFFDWQFRLQPWFIHFCVPSESYIENVWEKFPVTFL